MTNAYSVSLGARLRSLREGSSLTQSTLASETLIPESTLSRFENGSRTPSLEHARTLARYFAITLDELVEGTDSPQTGAHRPVGTRSGVTVPLSRSPQGLQAFKQVLPGRIAEDPVPEQRVHGGFDWMYVLSGRLRLLLGDHSIVIGPGEVAEFDTRVPHAYFSAGVDQVELLSLFDPEGERLHVRASTLPPAS